MAALFVFCNRKLLFKRNEDISLCLRDESLTNFWSDFGSLGQGFLWPPFWTKRRPWGQGWGLSGGHFLQFAFHRSQVQVNVLLIDSKQAKQCPVVLNYGKTPPSIPEDTVQFVCMSATQWPVKPREGHLWKKPATFWVIICDHTDVSLITPYWNSQMQEITAPCFALLVGERATVFTRV